MENKTQIKILNYFYVYNYFHQPSTVKENLLSFMLYINWPTSESNFGRKIRAFLKQNLVWKIDHNFADRKHNSIIFL